MFLVWFLTRAFIGEEDCAHVLCLVGSIMARKYSSIESQELQSANYTLALPQDINGLEIKIEIKNWADERIARMFFVGLNGRSTSCKLHTC